MGLSTVALPGSFAFKIASIDKDGDGNIVYTFAQQDLGSLAITDQTPVFVQTQAMTEAGIAVQPYGAIIVGKHVVATYCNIVLDLNGTAYKYGSSNSDKLTFSTAAVGDTITVYNSAQL